MNQMEYDPLILNHFRVISYAYTLDTYEMVFANDILLDFLGCKGSDLLKKSFSHIMGCDSPVSRLDQQQELQKGKVYKWSHSLPNTGKTFLLQDSVVEHQGGKLCIGYGYEKTEEEDFTQLQDAHTLDQAVIRCAEILLDKGDIDLAIHKLLETVAEYYDAERAYIYEADLSTETVSNTYEICRNGATPKIQYLQEVSLKEVPSWLNQLTTQDFISLHREKDQITSTSPQGKLLEQQEVDSLLLVPLKRGEVLSGFLGVNNPKRCGDQPKLLTTVSAFVFHDIEKRSVAMELCSTVNELQTSLDMSEMMFECAKILLNDSSTDLAVTHLLEAVSHYLGADSAYVFEYHKKERTLKNSYYYSNHSYSAPVHKNQNESAVLNQIHLSPKLVSTADDFFSHDFIPLRNRAKMDQTDTWEYQIFTALNCDTCIMAPFQKNGNFFGILGIDNPKTNMDHREVITTVAAFIVNTLEKRGIINKLEFLSYADELTGLKNRNAYLQKMKEYRRQDLTNFGIIYADLNDIKAVNEYLGHSEGDQLILWCVKFLQSHLRDPIYRIGGDEFICFVSGITEEAFASRVGALTKAQGRMNYINLAIASVWSSEVEDIDDEIFVADKFLYEEKERLHQGAVDKNLSEQQIKELTENRMNEINRVSRH